MFFVDNHSSKWLYLRSLLVCNGEDGLAGAKIFPCPFCEKTFAEKDMISEHMHQSHASWDVGDQSNTVTSRAYRSAGVQLREKSSSSRVFACPHCDLVFKKQNLLQVHVRTHPDPVERRRVAEPGSIAVY